MTGRPPTRRSLSSCTGPDTGPDSRRISEQAPLERCIGPGRGGARRHRPRAPDAGSGTPGGGAPASATPPGRRSRTTCPTPSRDAAAQLAQGGRRQARQAARRRPRDDQGKRVIKLARATKARAARRRSTSTTRWSARRTSSRSSSTSATRPTRHRRHARVRCTTRSRRRTATGTATPPTTTRRTGPRDFNRAHYQDMMFGEGESFKDFYLKQSNGRFLAKGDVSDWVKVPFNEAALRLEQASPDVDYWPSSRTPRNAWYDAQKAAGKSRRRDQDLPRAVRQGRPLRLRPRRRTSTSPTATSTTSRPSTPVRARRPVAAPRAPTRSGRTAGTPTTTTPARRARRCNKAGGVPIGNSGIWIGDYTTEPENGGLGVFAHEFGHDLGLPDLYDTAGGDNGTGVLDADVRWLVAQPRQRLDRHHAGLHGSVGEAPARLARLHDGALRHGHDGQARPGRPGDATRRPGRSSSRCPERTVVTTHNTPHSGSGEWWSGYGNDMTRRP